MGVVEKARELGSFLHVDEDMVTAEYSTEYNILQSLKTFNEDITVSDEDDNEEVTTNFTRRNASCIRYSTKRVRVSRKCYR